MFPLAYFIEFLEILNNMIYDSDHQIDYDLRLYQNIMQ